MSKVLKQKRIFFATGNVAISSMSITLLFPILSNHISDEFKLSNEIISVIFAAISISYAVTAPIVGALPKYIDKRIILILGDFLIFIGYNMSGPFESIFASELHTFIIGLCIIFIGAAIALIPSMPEMLLTANKVENVNIEDATNIISGIFYSARAFGNIIGLTISGVLVQNYGFADGLCYFSLVPLIYLVFYLTIGEAIFGVKTLCKDKYVPVPFEESFITQ